MVETPILELFSEDFVVNYGKWVCSEFIRDHFVRIPEKISLSFSTRKSKSAIAISFKFYSRELCYLVNSNEFRSCNKYGGTFTNLEDLLLKHYKFTKKPRILYVTLYDRTEA